MAGTTPPQRFVEQWSAITPGDLGLKAGYSPAVEGGAVTFRPIIGWVSVTRHDRVDGTTVNQFLAVVISDLAAPAPATRLPRFLGVFPLPMSPEEAWSFSAQWRKQDADPEAQVVVATQPPGKA